MLHALLATYDSCWIQQYSVGYWIQGGGRTERIVNEHLVVLISANTHERLVCTIRIRIQSISRNINGIKPRIFIRRFEVTQFISMIRCGGFNGLKIFAIKKNKARTNLPVLVKVVIPAKLE